MAHPHLFIFIGNCVHLSRTESRKADLFYMAQAYKTTALEIAFILTALIAKAEHL